MNKMTLRDVDLHQKKILMRVDFNVPLKDGKVADDYRILKALPSIKYVLKQNGVLILMSHLGRPKGKVNPELSLKPIATYLQNLLETSVHFATDCIDEEAEKTIAQAKPGEVVLLENLRFHKEEKENDEAFSKQLASLGDIYVNNAFGTCHRNHASVTGVPEHLKPAAAGFLIEEEIKYLSQATENAKHPYVAIIGGAKISDKIKVIEYLLDKVDSILIGGGMVYTFYRALEIEIGDSLIEEDNVNLAKELLQKAEKSSTQLVLPSDSVVANQFKNEANQKVVADEDGIPKGWMGLDIGPQTVNDYSKIIEKAKTVIWFGPMGVYEMKNFARGTNTVAQAMAKTTGQGATTVVGGGDSAAAVRNAGLEEQVTHVSTGGGASLMFIEGKELPGVAALSDK